MIPDSTPQRQKTAGLPQFLVLCLLLSFLLHLLLIWLIPRLAPESEPVPTEPTYVTLEEYPARPQSAPRELELDEPPRPDREPPEQASRLAEADRKVEQEMAPRGEDSRDRPAVQASAGTATAESVPQLPPAPPPRPEKKQPATPATPATPAQREPAATGQLPPEPAGEQQPLRPGSTPSIAELTRPTLDTLKRMARNEQRGGIKNREDVLEGDAVYLNLQQDYLLSFFKRFSNRIEAAWSYPAEAAQRSEQGTLLLKITVTREGELLDVDLLDSSGSDALDYEAIQAVYRAAPFGPVTRHWPHEQMKIYAHFQYTLSNRYIFGR